MSTFFGHTFIIYTYLVQTGRHEHGLRALLDAKDTMSYDQFLSLASMNSLEHRRCFAEFAITDRQAEVG